MKRSLLTVPALLTGMLGLAFLQPIAAQAAVTSLTGTSATLSKSTSALTVTGTIVCTAGDLYQVVVDVIQVSGGRSGIALGFTAPDTCSGGVDTWVTPARTEFGSLKNGNAQVIPEALDFTDSTGDTQVVHQPITPVP